MRKIYLFIGVIVVLGMMSCSYTNYSAQVFKSYSDSLRSLYSRPISQWPQPTIDSGAIWSAMAAIPKDDTSWFRSDKDP